MSRFQPLSGPGWKVHKKAGMLEQVRAEMHRRISELAGTANQVAVPPIVPADRGRHFRKLAGRGLVRVPVAHRDAVQEAVVAVMCEMEVEELDT